MTIKLAFFVEGQSELVFIRNIIPILFSNFHYSFECLSLRADKLDSVPYSLNNQNAQIHFQIIDVGNDSKVLSAIKDREGKLFEKGFHSVFGLRDMYSQQYREKSNGVIDPDLNEKYVAQHNEIIQRMSNADRIMFHFAVMEIEAWWLAMHTIFEKIDNQLTMDLINGQLGFRLDEVDPEEEFFKPSSTLNNILQLIGKEYQKKKRDVESITSHININDIDQLIENGKCISLISFFCDLNDICEEVVS